MRMNLPGVADPKGITEDGAQAARQGGLGGETANAAGESVDWLLVQYDGGTGVAGARD